MRAAIEKTQPWISSTAKSLNNNKMYSLRISIKDSVAHSFLIIEDINSKSFCFIPLSAEISVLAKGDVLSLEFSRYDGINVRFKYTDMLQLELMVSHIGKCSILVNDTPDKFEQENTAFLRTLEIKELKFTASLNEMAESSVVSPITLSKTAHSLWEKMTIKQNSQFYLSPQQIRFSILTWNVAGNTPSVETKEEFERVFSLPSASADFVIIAIEEIEMSVKYLVTGSTNHRAVWTDIITSSPEIGDNQEYELVCMETVGTVYIAVLVRKTFIHPYKVGPTQNMKLGVAGILANKAAVLIPITIGEAKIMVVSCHLEAHTQNNDARIDQVHQIFETIGEGYDYIFLAGDLNFRITLPYETAVNFARDNLHEQLLANDQLRALQQKDPVLSTLTEAEIHFNPTYKFDNDSDVYDTSQKRRVPSYTDRILYKKATPKQMLGGDPFLSFDSDVWKCFHQKDRDKFITDCNFGVEKPILNYPYPIECVCYRSLKSRFSDHRPVLGNFKIVVPIKNNDRMEELKSIMTVKYEEMKTVSIPKLSLDPPVIKCSNEKEMKVLLLNESLVWANWRIIEMHGKFSISPNQGLLLAKQKCELNLTFNDDFDPSNSFFTVSVIGGNNLVVHFNKELEIVVPEEQMQIYHTLAPAEAQNIKLNLENLALIQAPSQFDSDSEEPVNAQDTHIPESQPDLLTFEPQK